MACGPDGRLGPDGTIGPDIDIDRENEIDMESSSAALCTSKISSKLQSGENSEPVR